MDELIGIYDCCLTQINVVDGLAENFHSMPNNCRAVGRLGDPLSKGSILYFVEEVAHGSEILAKYAVNEIHTSASMVCFHKMGLTFSNHT